MEEKEQIHPIAKLMDVLIQLDDQDKDGNGHVMDGIAKYLGDYKCCAFCKNQGQHDDCDSKPGYCHACGYFSDKRRIGRDFDLIHFYRVLLKGKTISDVIRHLSERITEALSVNSWTEECQPDDCFKEHISNSKVHDDYNEFNQLVFTKDVKCGKKTKSYRIYYRLRNKEWEFAKALVFCGDKDAKLLAEEGFNINDVGTAFYNIGE